MAVAIDWESASKLDKSQARYRIVIEHPPRVRELATSTAMKANTSHRPFIG
jgi:hypothetical protein